MRRLLRLAAAVLTVVSTALVAPAQAFLPRHNPEQGQLHTTQSSRPSQSQASSTSTSESESASTTNSLAFNNTARQFTILTCSSTACAKTRKSLGLDPLATYTAFYARGQQELDGIRLAECPCLGACQQAPCVGIEHDDYLGTVALNGMEPAEFANRVFYRVVSDDDVDRVWKLLRQAIDAMAKQEMTANKAAESSQDDDDESEDYI